MTINYTVKKMTMKPSSKEHIEKKLDKLQKFFSDSAEATIKFNLDSGSVTAEITVKDGSMVYRGEDNQVDLVDSFDNAFDHIIRRIRKQKTKLEKRVRTNAFEVEYFSDFDDESYDEEDSFEIIRSKQFDLKPLSVEEAILQMNLLGHHFFMFDNAQTNKVSVVYLRNDGKYGLIEPK